MSDEEDFIFDEEELEEYMSDGDEIHEEDTTPEEEIREHMDFSTVVVAENLPKVPAAKFEKLKAFIINKAFNKAGTIVHDKLVVPQNKDGSTKGIAIIQYEDREAVTKAIAFNKNKIRFTAVDLKVRHFDEVHRIVRPPKSSQNKLPQTVEEYKPYIDACNASHHKLRSWLSDPQVRDQYAIRYAKETEIFWCGRNAEIDLEYGAEVEKADNMTLTEMSVQWSPRGSYLGSFHPQGIALWGGAKVSRETKTGDRVDGWAKIKRFKHLGVTNIAFSPKEKFLVTSNVRSAQRATVQFFDVFSGDLKRSFQVQASEEQSMEALAHLFRPDSNDSGQNAPIFKWSHSERYFARKTSNNEDCSAFTRRSISSSSAENPFKQKASRLSSGLLELLMPKTTWTTLLLTLRPKRTIPQPALPSKRSPAAGYCAKNQFSIPALVGYIGRTMAITCARKSRVIPGLAAPSSPTSSYAGFGAQTIQWRHWKSASRWQTSRGNPSADICSRTRAIAFA